MTFAGVTCGSFGFSSHTTAYSLFGPRCAYRLVIVRLLCPNKSAVSSSGAPFIRSLLAECRKSCHRKFFIPATITASSNQCRPFSSGSPVSSDWNTRAFPSPRACTTLKAATAATFKGTCTGSSFFVRGMFNIRPLKSTMSHVRLYLTALLQTGIDCQI